MAIRAYQGERSKARPLRKARQGSGSPDSDEKEGREEKINEEKKVV
jgi:hypothetical protein